MDDLLDRRKHRDHGREQDGRKVADKESETGLAERGDGGAPIEAGVFDQPRDNLGRRGEDIEVGERGPAENFPQRDDRGKNETCHDSRMDVRNNEPVAPREGDRSHGHRLPVDVAATGRSGVTAESSAAPGMTPAISARGSRSMPSSAATRSASRWNSAEWRCAARRGRGSGTANSRDDSPRPRAHHDDLVGEKHRFLDRMGDEEAGRASPLPDARQFDIEPASRQFVDRTERLVEKEEARPRDQAAGDRGALAHAAGEFGRLGALEAGEADQMEEGSDGARVDPLAGEPAGERDIGFDRPPGKQRRILKRDSNLSLSLDRVGRSAVDGHGPRGRLVEPGDNAEKGRLPTARRPDQGRHGAGTKREIDAVQGGDLAPPTTELFGDPGNADLRRDIGPAGDDIGIESSTCHRIFLPEPSDPRARERPPCRGGRVS